MPTGTVQAKGLSQTGKAQVTIDGQKYSASRSVPSMENMQIGDRIEFDSNSSVYNGKNVWFLNTWKLLEGAAKYPATPVAAPNGSPQGRPLAQAPAASKDAPVQDAERPAISNWIAAAIQAGFIAKPEQIVDWVNSAKIALRTEGFGTDRDIP
jgi:hypothetical protein